MLSLTECIIGPEYGTFKSAVNLLKCRLGPSEMGQVLDFWSWSPSNSCNQSAAPVSVLPLQKRQQARRAGSRVVVAAAAAASSAAWRQGWRWNFPEGAQG